MSQSNSANTPENIQTFLQNDAAKPTPQVQPKNPLHGLTLQTILTKLVEHYGWEDLAVMIRINCFKSDPSIKSSLKFLRKTQWARQKVEQLYLDTF
jgi:uncharacterized protein (DUF2132 family)